MVRLVHTEARALENADRPEAAEKEDALVQARQESSRETGYNHSGAVWNFGRIGKVENPPRDTPHPPSGAVCTFGRSGKIEPPLEAERHSSPANPSLNYGSHGRRRFGAHRGGDAPRDTPGERRP